MLLSWMILLTAGWLVVGVLTRRQYARVPRIDPQPPGAPVEDGEPLISIVVPARNEADRVLAQSVGSFLAQDWPRLEVVAVNDRSTDATGEILAALGAPLIVVQGTEPPLGWMGKTNAMAVGLEQAHGDWILFTDADMVFHPAAARRAVETATAFGVDLVTLIPSFDSEHFGVSQVMPVAGWMIFRLFPPTATNDPEDPRALGCGGFLMVRRRVIEAIGGLAAIAGDVADDVALATAVKRAGYRLLCGYAPDLAYTPMYASLREVWDGFGKNAYWGLRGRIDLVIAATLANLLTGVLPVLLLGCSGALGWAALAAWLAMSWAFAHVYQGYGLPGWRALGAPFAFAFMTGLLLSSMVRNLTGRGVSWRGRTVTGGKR